MADEDSDLEKTEEPTPRKREQALENGQILTSQEAFVFGAMAVATGLCMFVVGQLPQIAGAWGRMLRIEGDLDALMIDRLVDLGWYVLLFGLGAAVPVMMSVIGLQALMGGLHFNGPSFKGEKLNPFSGMKRMVSMQALINLLKSLIKVGILGVLAYTVFKAILLDLDGLGALEPATAAARIGQMVVDLLSRLALGLAAIAAVDLAWQYRTLMKGLMMTKDEVKRESKEQNGSPELKGKIRQKQMQAARRAGRQRKALADVPQATAIITNPTHFAVALRYVPGETDAPVILAMGRGPIAHEIMDIGRKAAIHTLRLPPLARALYYSGEIGMQIDDRLFAAVAAVLAHVFRVDRGEAVDLPDIDLPPEMRFDVHGRPETPESPRSAP